MATAPDKELVQTVLTFSPAQTGASEGNAMPRFARLAQSDVDSLTDQVDMDVENDQKSQEIEYVQSTQSTSISWPSTTAPRHFPRADDGMGTFILKQQQRRRLAYVAQETTQILPGLLSLVPHAKPDGYLYARPQPPQLHRKYCPNFAPTAIRIHDADTFDTAIGLAQCAKYITVKDKRPVCVLNMANASTAGGGWKNGALAQEEALCYRSSLSFTLKLRYYPIPEFGAIYSPTVIVIRKNLQEGHDLYSLDKPEELPVVSVVSVAALCEPEVTVENTVRGSRERYANAADRKTTKEKMRVILRTAAFNGHRRLVLGALGCGAFHNPREEVANCWAEVFAEQEFSGGWWESVIFAVMDDTDEGESGNGNFGVFFRRLNGMMV